MISVLSIGLGRFCYGGHETPIHKHSKIMGQKYSLIINGIIEFANITV